MLPTITKHLTLAESNLRLSIKNRYKFTPIIGQHYTIMVKSMKPQIMKSIPQFAKGL